MENTVSVVDLPPNNLKRLLIRNRMYDRICVTSNCVICPSGRSGDCMCMGTVYSISCLKCGEEYIGETGRPLCVRAKEHLDGTEKSRISTPLGAHKIWTHAGEHIDVHWERFGLIEGALV